MNKYTKYIDKLSYLNYFNNNNKDYIFNEDIDIILGTGGLRGIYYCGVSYIINKYINPNNIKSITAVSAGALGAVIIACDIHPKKCIYYYYYLYKEYNKNKSLLESLELICHKLLPDNAYKICNKRNVNIVLTELSCLGFNKVIITKYYSNKHLIDCIIASSYIPFMYNNGFPLCYKINNKYYLDGGFTDDLPYNINSKNKQILISTINIYHNFRYILSPDNIEIDRILLLGIYDMYKFIKTKKNSTNIQYYNKNINVTRNLNNTVYNILGLIILFYIINSIFVLMNIKINHTINKIFIFQKFIINIIVLFVMILLLFLNKMNCYI